MTSASRAQMSDEAIARGTGRTWKEWLRVLDAIGARGMSHHDIAMRIWRDFALTPWWSQAVTMGYERIRGIRDIGHKDNGFTAGASRTIAASSDRVRRAWMALGHRQPADGTRVFVTIDELEPRKVRVFVGHERLLDAKARLRQKKRWAAVLEQVARAAE